MNIILRNKDFSPINCLKGHQQTVYVHTYRGLHVVVPKNLGMYIPRTQMTSIFEGQSPKTRPLFNQNKGHLGSRYTYIYICTPMYLQNICMTQKNTLNIAFFVPKKKHENETTFASTIFSSWRRHGKKRCLRRIAGQLLVTRRCIPNFRPKIQVEEVAHFLFRHTKRWENMKACETKFPGRTQGF